MQLCWRLPQMTVSAIRNEENIMKKLGIIGAMDVEVATLKEKMEEKSVRTWKWLL